MMQNTAETLNLGAGKDTLQNAHNVDIQDLAGIDNVVDLDAYPWPYPDNAFRNVIAKHVLEHLEDPLQALDEIIRVLEPGGTFVWWYPIGHTRFEDPTHKHYWNYNTAAAITGERKHEHEFTTGLELVYRDVDWRCNSRVLSAYVAFKARKDGYGPWVGQIPGLHGKVIAHYKK